MRFFLITALIFGIFQGHAAYEHADAIVREHARRTGVPVSRLVLLQNAQEAENRTQTSRFSGVSYKAMADIFLLPHSHILDSISYLINPVFTEERAATVASCFFPSAGEELIPNTVAINEPVGKLNVANQRDAESKKEATRRLGAFARILQDGITDGSVSVDDLVQRFLKAWGVADPAQIKVFNDFAPEVFAREELKAAVLRGQAEAQKIIASYLRGEGEHDQEGNEIEADLSLKRFQQAFAHPTTPKRR